MTPLDWAVLLAGIGAIAWVNWYFFLAGRSPAAGQAAGGAAPGITETAGRERRS